MKNKKILILANLDVGLYKFRKALIKKLIDQGNEVYISLPKGMLVQNLKEMGCHFIETPVDRRGINPATDFKPVSYTHLDVYKRQAWKRASESQSSINHELCQRQSRICHRGRRIDRK